MSVAGRESPDVKTASSSDGHDTIVTRRRDPVRLAGMLLLIGFCFDLSIYGIQWRWAFTPMSTALADTALQAVLGIGLLYYGRLFSLPTFVFLVAVALIPCVRGVLTLLPIAQEAGIPAMAITASAPLILGLFRASPFILLLVPKFARVGYAVAISLYVLYQVVHLALVAMNIYVMNWLALYQPPSN